MSIESKHAYRFGFLKSEKWKSVRLEALVRERGKCQICGEESIHNDAHHIWYPENIYETTEDHLAVLCRTCHDFVHVMLPDCKTKDEDLGKASWFKLKNAIIAWRQEKTYLFSELESNPPKAVESWKAKDLRTAFELLKQKYHLLYSKYQKSESQLAKFSFDSSKKQSE